MTTIRFQVQLPELPKSTSEYLSILLLIAFWLTEYSYGLLIGTLAIVEDPRQQNVQDERRAITCSLRTTITHLRATAGRWFWLRGAFHFLAYRMVANGNTLSILPDIAKSSWVIQLFVGLSLGFVVANWQVTWVHAIISKPSTESCLERFLRYRWNSAILSTMPIHMTLHYGALTCATRIRDTLLQHLDPMFDPFSPVQVFATLFPRIVQCLVSIFVRILFIRLAASTLPPDEQPIVILDPTLGGHYGHWIAGAWSTFSSPELARARRMLVTQFALGLTISVLRTTVNPETSKYVELPLVWVF